MPHEPTAARSEKLAVNTTHYALHPLFSSQSWTTDDFASVLRVEAPEWGERTERRVDDRDLRGASPSQLVQDLASDAVAELQDRIVARLASPCWPPLADSGQTTDQLDGKSAS